MEKLLTSLRVQTFKDFEIVFVDNASRDNSVKLLRESFDNPFFKKLKIKLVLNEVNLGYCRGNNVGLTHAEGHYIVFLNNDTYVSPEWLEELVKVLDNYPSVGACQSKIVYAGTDKVQTTGNLCDKFLSSGITPPINLVKHTQDGVLVNTFFSPSGASTIFRKRILDKLGGFDGKLFSGDYDLGWRVRLLGYKIATSLTSTCYHYGGHAVKKLFPSTRVAFHDYREKIYVMAKNYSLSRVVTRIPISLFLRFFESVYSSLRFRKPYVAMFMKAIIWNLINLKVLMKKRKKVQRIRVVSDEEIEKHMTSYPFFIYGVREKLKSIL